MSQDFQFEPDPLREQMRRRVVLMVHTIYWLLIVEGALRKWAFPEAERFLFFIRDPFLIAALFWSIKGRLISRNPLLICLIVLGVAELFISGIQVAIDGFNPLIAGYGIRNYFFYALLAVIIPSAFVRSDMMTLIRWTLIAVIPMAMLVVVQFLSPKTALINKSGGLVFTVDEVMVRTTGTFTFTAGMACFNAVSLVFLIIAYYEQRREPLFRFWVFLVVACAVATCLAVSGSRTSFAQAGITVSMVLFMEMIKPAQRQRIDIMIGIVGLMIGFTLFMFMVFPTALDALWRRHEGANREGDSTIPRMIEMMIGVRSENTDYSLIGEGIGSRSNAASMMRSAHETVAYTEWEVDRIFTEVGLIAGGAYMLLRWAIAIYIFAGGVRSLREHDDTITLLLWSIVGTWMVQGLLTSQGTINGYGWIITGLAFHAIQSSGQRSVPPDPQHSAVVTQGERM